VLLVAMSGMLTCEIRNAKRIYFCGHSYVACGRELWCQIAERPMKIDIDRLSEEELVELSHNIVSRLRFLLEMRSHVQMLDFRIGERVGFRPAGRPEVFGMLTRYNKKSVAVITDGGEHWTV
jgi:hypothetical protein